MKLAMKMPLSIWKMASAAGRLNKSGLSTIERSGRLKIPFAYCEFIWPLAGINQLARPQTYTSNQ